MASVTARRRAAGASAPAATGPPDMRASTLGSTPACSFRTAWPASSSDIPGVFAATNSAAISSSVNSMSGR